MIKHLTPRDDVNIEEYNEWNKIEVVIDPYTLAQKGKTIYTFKRKDGYAHFVVLSNEFIKNTENLNICIEQCKRQLRNLNVGNIYKWYHLI